MPEGLFIVCGEQLTTLLGQQISAPSLSIEASRSTLPERMACRNERTCECHVKLAHTNSHYMTSSWKQTRRTTRHNTKYQCASSDIPLPYLRKTALVACQFWFFPIMQVCMVIVEVTFQISGSTRNQHPTTSNLSNCISTANQLRSGLIRNQPHPTQLLCSLAVVWFKTTDVLTKAKGYNSCDSSPPDVHTP